MEHITEQYGQECNILKLTSSEFWTLKEFMGPMGVELRAISYDGATDIYTIQGRNPIMNACMLYGDRPANWVFQQARKEIQDGSWRR